MAKNKKNKKADSGGPYKTRTEIRVERFIIEEIDKYIKLHKQHSKDLRYIG